jgi:hypothetical protein
VEPTRGEAPLAVRLSATLAGNVALPPDAGCPTLAWTLGNGDVILAEARGCEGGELPRAFTLDYSYRGAGSFDAGVRLLALDVPASNRVSVLVQGPTATPAPRLAQAGPTIVIATAAAPTQEPPTELPPTQAQPSPAATTGIAAARASATQVSPPPATAAPGAAAPATPEATSATQVAMGPTAVPTAVPAVVPATSAGPAGGTAAGPRPTAPAAPAAGRVLPADLYYLTPRGATLMRIDAAGSRPRALTGPVSEYAVTPGGLLAWVALDTGILQLLAPGGEPIPVARDARRPVWSPDGRQLAYAADGVYAYQLGSAARRRLADGGEPLAWNRDGRWLALRRPDGGLSLASAAGARQDLPIGGVQLAGWLPDRDVVWAGGEGLVLVTVGDTVQQARLLEPAVKVLAANATADGRLLALADAGEGPRQYRVDLAAALPAAVPDGPPLAGLPDLEGLAWAPGGQLLAVAPETGPLGLLAPANGAGVGLVPEGGQRPAWVLAVPRGGEE